MTSSTIASYGFARAIQTASSPVAATSVGMPLLTEPTSEQARELRLVLDHQHAHRVHCGRRTSAHGALIVLSSPSAPMGAC